MVKMGPSQVPQSVQCLLSTTHGYLVEVVGWAPAETVLCVTYVISLWVRGKRLVESSLRKWALKNWKHLCQTTQRILFCSGADPQCKEKATLDPVQQYPAALSLPSFTFISTCLHCASSAHFPSSWKGCLLLATGELFLLSATIGISARSVSSEAAPRSLKTGRLFHWSSHTLCNIWRRRWQFSGQVWVWNVTFINSPRTNVLINLPDNT